MPHKPECWETGTLPTWEQVKASHSKEWLQDQEKRLERAKKIVAAARKADRQSKEVKPAQAVIIVKQC